MENSSTPFFVSAQRSTSQNTDSTVSTEPGDFPRLPHITSFSSTAPLVDRPFVWWTSLLVMFAGLLVPIVLVEVPPLTDYPNHLARSYVLAYGQDRPLLNQMVVADWKIVPNLAIDLILPPLMRIFPVLVAGRIVLALCLLIPASGAVALSYAYFRRRSFFQMGAGFVAFNGLLLLGLINFQISIGVALWGAAGWISFSKRSAALTCASGIPIAIVVFFLHVFGFLFYAALIGSYELCQILRNGVSSPLVLRFAVRRISILLMTFAIPLTLFLLAPTEANPTIWSPVPEKAFFLFLPFLTYSLSIDVPIFLPLLAFIVVCIVTGRMRFAPAALICGACLLVAYMALPTHWHNGRLIDARVPILAGFMLFSGMMPVGFGARSRAVFAASLLVLFVIKIGFVTTVWLGSQQDVADVRQVIRPVVAGSRVLVLDNPSQSPTLPLFRRLSRRIPRVDPTYWHYPAFLLLDRDAFWSDMFSQQSQQPIKVTEAYQDTTDGGRSPPANYLDLTMKQIPLSVLKNRSFLIDWNLKFDYVLLLNADAAKNLSSFLPDQLELLDEKGIAALFKVKK
jgi:hypothetical protein